MPKYKVKMTWSETQYYSSEIEVEADDEEQATELAEDRRFDNYDSNDSETNDDLSTEVTCLEDDEEEECVSKSKRDLPDWF